MSYKNVPEPTKSVDIEDMPLETNMALVLIVDNFVPKPKLGMSFLNCFTGDNKKIVCAVPSSIRLYLKTDDVVMLKNVHLMDKGRKSTRIAVGRDINFHHKFSYAYLLARGSQEFALPKLLHPTNTLSTNENQSVASESNFSDVITYAGTLTQEFGTCFMNFQGKLTEFFVSKMCKRDNKSLSILITKDVFLPLILREGHIISATGREMTAVDETFLLVSKKENLFFEGMTKPAEKNNDQLFQNNNNAIGSNSTQLIVHKSDSDESL